MDDRNARELTPDECSSARVRLADSSAVSDDLVIGRRSLLLGALAGLITLRLEAAQLPSWLRGQIFCCTGDDPIGCIYRDKMPILVALLEAQLESLWGGRPGDSAVAAAEEYVRYVSHLEPLLQRGVCAALTWLNLYSFTHTGRSLSSLSTDERRKLLNQGEYPVRFDRRGKPLPLVRWEEDFPFHMAVSSLSMIGRLIVNSRSATRHLIGLHWSEVCQDASRLVHMDPPPYPNLDVEYDLCVIGSGCGGVVVAARAAAEGKRVLFIEAGDWVSPDALVEQERDRNGRIRVMPPRGDTVLMRLYKGAGVQIAGSLGQMQGNAWKLLLPNQRRQIEPKQTVNIVQAETVGGGPYVNNAIHLEVQEHVWESWGERRPPGVTFADFRERMLQVKRDLGVNDHATRECSGERSVRFVAGCVKAGEIVEPLPVSIREDCDGCGADNSVDPFGDHIGGLHPYRPGQPNSYLMRALHARTPAQVAYLMRAVRFGLRLDQAGTWRVDHLVVEDRRGVARHANGCQRKIRAKQFVLAAGAINSTIILRNTLCHAGLRTLELGERLTANVGTPFYAVYDKPIITGPTERPEPGIAQCFVVERKFEFMNGQRIEVEPTLENWFHFPGTVAVALTGWFSHYGEVMRKYNHISMAGCVVPTKVRPENRVNADGSVQLTVDDEEFELLVRGLHRMGRIYLADATPDNGVTLHLPTKGLLLDPCGKPLVIRDHATLEYALNEIRARGAAFLNLITAHPQGGNSLGSVVDPQSFRVQLDDGQKIDNLFVADASIFPAGCEINPQLTIAALASYVADAIVGPQQQPHQAGAPTPAYR